jgi:hypothetical protein
MKRFNSDQILQADDLYNLQDTFASSGIPFQYEMTEAEIGWLQFVKGRYCIADWILANLEANVLTFNCPFELSEALIGDGMAPKAVCLSDDTALQRLFFWLADSDLGDVC